jgi:RNA polymerase sigma-70 factor (ECF subfamily)
VEGVESERDDRALVAAVRAGDTDAFAEIVARHRRAVYQVCYRFVNDPDAAADLTQETFVRAWRGLDRFRGSSALSTWLFRIAINVCLNRRSAEPPPHDVLDAHQLEDASAESPDRRLIRAERARRVRRAIAALPDRQRATVILRVYHGLSHREIAAALGNSVGATRANLFHALTKLRTMLGSEP